MNKRIFICVSLFSIAMAFLESSVVVYLRALYYPEGFGFPLVPIGSDISTTEIIREAATLIMLIGIGIVAGKSKLERFAYFIYSFAIRDIFYYVFLKIILNWPVSFFTWDVLFLIPVTWVGPVIAPIITSLTMILLACTILHFSKRNTDLKMLRKEWFALILGSVITIISFVKDYLNYMHQQHPSSNWWTLDGESLFTLAGNYIPQEFNWWIFIVAEIIILVSIFNFGRRNQKLLTKNKSNLISR